MPWGVIPHPLPEVNFLMVEIPTPKPYIFMIRVTRQICFILGYKKKLPVGDGDDLRPQLLGHFICLFTLIINIYGLGEGISTIKQFTSGRGWGMTPRAYQGD
jgi:hypothetical protein